MDRTKGFILAGVTAIGIVGGTTLAVVQPNRQGTVTPDRVQSGAMAPSNSASVSSTSSTNSDTAENTTNPQSDTAVSDAAEDMTVAPSRQVQSCTVSMAVVDDPNPPLNVRSAPTTAEDNIVGKLENGTFLDVRQEQPDWFQITAPVEGWVASSRTRFSCNQKVEQVNFGTGNTSTEISDRFIGTGSHQYLLRAREGQTLTLTRQSGPFPSLSTPDGKTLVTGPDDNRDRWSGTLPATGDYILWLDSNYKGYTYSFVVDIN